MFFKYNFQGQLVHFLKNQIKTKRKNPGDSTRILPTSTPGRPEPPPLALSPASRTRPDARRLPLGPSPRNTWRGWQHQWWTNQWVKGSCTALSYEERRERDTCRPGGRWLWERSRGLGNCVWHRLAPVLFLSSAGAGHQPPPGHLLSDCSWLHGTGQVPGTDGKKGVIWEVPRGGSEIWTSGRVSPAPM